MKFPRRVIVGIAVLATVALSAVTRIPEAAAAPYASTAATMSATSCTGSCLDGTDPYATGCANGAYVVGSGETQYGLLELWWSPACQTNWATYDSYSTLPTRLWIETQDGRSTGFLYFSGYEGRTWTAQLYAPNTNVRACVQVYEAAIHSWSAPSCVGQY